MSDVRGAGRPGFDKKQQCYCEDLDSDILSRLDNFSRSAEGTSHQTVGNIIRFALVPFMRSTYERSTVVSEVAATWRCAIHVVAWISHQPPVIRM